MRLRKGLLPGRRRRAAPARPTPIFFVAPSAPAPSVYYYVVAACSTTARDNRERGWVRCCCFRDFLCSPCCLEKMQKLSSFLPAHLNQPCLALYTDPKYILWTPVDMPPKPTRSVIAVSENMPPSLLLFHRHSNRRVAPMFSTSPFQSRLFFMPPSRSNHASAKDPRDIRLKESALPPFLTCPFQRSMKI